MSQVQESVTETGPVTAVGKHVMSVYRKLDEVAVDEVRGEDTLRVFRGSFLSAYEGAGVSRSYYGTIRRILEDLSSITEIQKGGRNVESVIILHGLPNPNAVDSMVEALQTPTEVKRNDLERRIITLEQQLQGVNFVIALSALSDSIDSLTERITALESNNNVDN